MGPPHFAFDISRIRLIQTNRHTLQAASPSSAQMILSRYLYVIPAETIVKECYSWLEWRDPGAYPSAKLPTGGTRPLLRGPCFHWRRRHPCNQSRVYPQTRGRVGDSPRRKLAEYFFDDITSLETILDVVQGESFQRRDVILNEYYSSSLPGKGKGRNLICESIN